MGHLTSFHFFFHTADRFVLHFSLFCDLEMGFQCRQLDTGALIVIMGSVTHFFIFTYFLYLFSLSLCLSCRKRFLPAVWCQKYRQVDTDGWFLSGPLGKKSPPQSPAMKASNEILLNQKSEQVDANMGRGRWNKKNILLTLVCEWEGDGYNGDAARSRGREGGWI